MDVKRAIQDVVAGRSLSEEDAFAVAGALIEGRATEGQIGALLVALRMKGETVAEITGFARAMRRAATRLPVEVDGAVDTCGTGGDASGTFNISTVAAIVAAAAGCRVAKHGNRSISSRSGSADVLAALGVSIEMPPERSAESLREIGISFLYAPLYHPGVKHAAAARREIGIRSIFNILGPLSNPAGSKRQLLGVFAPHLTRTMAEVLERLGGVHCLVVHGEDGLDEITLCGLTWICELRDGALREYSVDPEQLGLARARPEDLAGGEPADNARIAVEVLEGGPGPRRAIVEANAGAVIYAAGCAGDLLRGVQKARAAIESGAAMAKLEQLRRFSRDA